MPDTISPSEELPELEIGALVRALNTGARDNASATRFNGSTAKIAAWRTPLMSYIRNLLRIRSIA